MANYIPTNILKAISKATGLFGQAEFREGSNATLALMAKNEPLVFKNVKALKQSDKQPTEAIMQKRVVEASGTAKSAAHASAGFDDSFVAPIDYVRRTQTFSVSYKMAENNQFGYQEQLNAALANRMMNLRKDINAYILAQLSANKTQIATDSIIAFDGTNDAFANPLLEADFLAANLKAALKKNKYSGVVDVIAEQKAFRSLVHSNAQGIGNDENLFWQFGNMNIAEEETLEVPAAFLGGYLYAFQSGFAGITSWNEPINRNGEYSNAGDNKGLFTTIADPVIPGLTYDVHVKGGVSDSSGSNGHEQDIVDEYEVTAIFAFGSAFLSTATETPIIAVGQLNA